MLILHHSKPIQITSDIKFNIKKTNQEAPYSNEYRTHMANWALKCPIIILIIARSFCSYNNIFIIIQHPWTVLTENSAS